MKRNSIPMTVIRTVTVCFAVASAGIAVAQSNSSEDWRRHKGCSDRTLFGDYGTKVEGMLLGQNGGPNPPLRTLVLFHFEGNGNLTQRDYVVLNGKPLSDNFREPSGGTYGIEPDCTGWAELVAGPKFHFIVVKNGKQFFLVTDGNAISGIGSKVE